MNSNFTGLLHFLVGGLLGVYRRRSPNEVVDKQIAVAISQLSQVRLSFCPCW